jgi:hypothetical protein
MSAGIHDRTEASIERSPHQIGPEYNRRECRQDNSRIVPGHRLQLPLLVSLSTFTLLGYRQSGE